MKTYIVQARFSVGQRLVSLGWFRATDETRAIIQAAKVLAGNGENAFEFVATPMERGAK